MPEALVYEFQGVTSADYAAVSRHLGIDPETGEGDWPPGMLSHAAGTADDGTSSCRRYGPLGRIRLPGSTRWPSRLRPMAWQSFRASAGCR